MLSVKFERVLVAITPFLYRNPQALGSSQGFSNNGILNQAQSLGILVGFYCPFDNCVQHTLDSDQLNRFFYQDLCFQIYRGRVVTYLSRGIPLQPRNTSILREREDFPRATVFQRLSRVHSAFLSGLMMSRTLGFSLS